jgi:hypothetical protein
VIPRFSADYFVVGRRQKGGLAKTDYINTQVVTQVVLGSERSHEHFIGALKCAVL